MRKPKAKWRLGLCQSQGCRKQNYGRKPFCLAHYKARLKLLEKQESKA